MDSIAISTLLIGIVVGISCSLMGVLLILRRMSMVVDAISHTVLLGIVLAYMVVQDLSSPWLMVGATLMGVLTVVLIELLVSTKRVSEDAATGTIFPLLFSLAVILITTRYRNTHLDTHAISGNLEFAAFEQLTLFNVNIGSKTLFISSVVLIVLILIIVAFYKEFKITIFDYALAKTLGLAPIAIHYLMMTMVSVTAVTSFNSVGTILVVAMMIGPAAASLLITKNLSSSLVMAGVIAAFNATLGYFVAMVLFDGSVNIATTIVVVTFLTFLIVWIFEPKRGLLTSLQRRHKQQDEIASIALLTHMTSHDEKQFSMHQLTQALNWNDITLKSQLNKEKKRGVIIVENDIISLSSKGYDYYRQLLSKYNDD